jgi:hypothetical protein
MCLVSFVQSVAITCIMLSVIMLVVIDAEYRN